MYMRLPDPFLGKVRSSYCAFVPKCPLRRMTYSAEGGSNLFRDPTILNILSTEMYRNADAPSLDVNSWSLQEGITS